MNETQRTTIHDEMNQLLPWYVNGTLEADERRRVQAHLEDCGECRQDLSVLERIGEGVRQGPAKPLVHEPRVGEFMSMLDDRDTTRRRLHFGAVAAVFVAVAAATLLFPSLLDRDDARTLFETVINPDSSPGMDYVLRLSLAPGTSDADRQELFEDMNVRAVYRESTTDNYRVVIRLGATSLPEMQAFTEALESRPQVIAVETVALQLPVEAQD